MPDHLVEACRTYQRLRKDGLPIPDDIRKDRNEYFFMLRRLHDPKAGTRRKRK